MKRAGEKPSELCISMLLVAVILLFQAICPFGLPCVPDGESCPDSVRLRSAAMEDEEHSHHRPERSVAAKKELSGRKISRFISNAPVPAESLREGRAPFLSAILERPLLPECVFPLSRRHIWMQAFRC